MRAKPRCVFILSTRSAGSSALQRSLLANGGARVLDLTRHATSDRDGRQVTETLYWTKVASALGLPQVPMPNSEVPIPSRRARREIEGFLHAYGIAAPDPEETSYFAAWDALCARHAPQLLEKSPHHLYQPSAVGLMERYADWSRVADVRFMGLVRNPMDTLYSSWRRFGIMPAREEAHWVRAYRSLMDLARRQPELVTILRYEDLAGRQPGAAGSGATRFHPDSLGRWRRDSSFGFALSDDARAVARDYGYVESELDNPAAYPAWHWRQEPRALGYRVFTAVPSAWRLRLRARARRVLARSADGRDRPVG